MPAEQSPRRRYPRLRSQYTVLFEAVETMAEEALARTTAMGLGGLSFTTEEVVEVGARLRVFVALRNEVVEAEARVVYVNPAGESAHEVGVCFTDVEEEHLNRIARLFEPEPAASSTEISEAPH